MCDCLGCRCGLQARGSKRICQWLQQLQRQAVIQAVRHEVDAPASQPLLQNFDLSKPAQQPLYELVSVGVDTGRQGRQGLTDRVDGCHQVHVGLRSWTEELCHANGVRLCLFCQQTFSRFRP